MKNNLLKNWMKKWLLEIKQTVKESTYNSYKNTVKNHIVGKLGDYRIAELNNKIIQNYVFALIKNGRTDGKGGLSLTVVKHIVMLLKLAIKKPINDETIFNKIFLIKFPHEYKNSKIDVLSTEEQKAIIKLVQMNLNYKTMGILFCLSTGIRIGELCALQWKDVDLNSRTVHIKRTIQRIYTNNILNNKKSKIIFSFPKTQNAYREIPLSTILINLLTQIKFSKNDFLLSGGKKYVEPRVYRRFFESFLRKHKLRQIKFHGLRHTFATKCVENKVDYKIISELLGHTSITTTLNLYVHPNMEEKRRCVENLLDVL
ncbi:MAG: site-specific integrase [Fusobacteriaceae bacterium]|nr:site-specific integrase [Fusobacteriaceae bacterium]